MPTRPRCRALLVQLGLLVLLLATFASRASALVVIDWIEIGDAGNAPDPSTGRGSVAEPYRIAKFEVTVAQYAEFLNAVAASDGTVLGDISIFEGQPSTSSPPRPIKRSGTFGNFVYTVEPGTENAGFSGASFYDAIRFANWLHNGQPVGDIGPATTEDGAYTITAAGVTANDIARNPDARVVLANEDEWFKAAYYDAATSSYFDYPAGSNDPMTCSVFPVPDPNTANCGHHLRPVGAYSGSASPYGTFDQAHFGGEWFELIGGGGGLVRGSGSSFTPFHRQSDVIGSAPSNETIDTTIRLAAPAATGVPSMHQPGLVLIGLTLLLTGGRGLRRLRRLRRELGKPVAMG